MVKEDPSHTFIVARSFLDDTLFVLDDYKVPTTGKLTTVSWNGTYISEDTKNDDGSPKLYSVSCYVIPNEYWDILSKYFN